MIFWHTYKTSLITYTWCWFKALRKTFALQDWLWLAADCSSSDWLLWINAFSRFSSRSRLIFFLSFCTSYLQHTSTKATQRGKKKHLIVFPYTGRLPFNGIIDFALTTELPQRFSAIIGHLVIRSDCSHSLISMHDSLLHLKRKTWISHLYFPSNWT